MRRLILLLLISHALAQTSTTTQTQSVAGVANGITGSGITAGVKGQPTIANGTANTLTSSAAWIDVTPFVAANATTSSDYGAYVQAATTASAQGNAVHAEGLPRKVYLNSSWILIGGSFVGDLYLGATLWFVNGNGGTQALPSGVVIHAMGRTGGPNYTAAGGSAIVACSSTVNAGTDFATYCASTAYVTALATGNGGGDTSNYTALLCFSNFACSDGNSRGASSTAFGTQLWDFEVNCSYVANCVGVENDYAQELSGIYHLEVKNWGNTNGIGLSIGGGIGGAQNSIVYDVQLANGSTTNCVQAASAVGLRIWGGTGSNPAPGIVQKVSVVNNCGGTNPNDDIEIVNATNGGMHLEDFHCESYGRACVMLGVVSVMGTGTEVDTGGAANNVLIMSGGTGPGGVGSTIRIASSGNFAGASVTNTHIISVWQTTGAPTNLIGDDNNSAVLSASFKTQVEYLTDGSGAVLIDTSLTNQSKLYNAHGISLPLACASASASGTAYTCTTTPSFTPGDRDIVSFEADVASGATPTIAVNGAAAAATKKQGGNTAVAANDFIAGGHYLIQWDGTVWQVLSSTGVVSGANILGNLTVTSVSVSNGFIDKSAGFLSVAMTTQTTATCTNVTNMTWLLAANKNYILGCRIPRTLAASATLQYCIGGPGTATGYSLDVQGANGTAGAWIDLNTLAQTAYGTKTTASAAAANTAIDYVYAGIQNGATASGTALTLQTAANGTNTIQVLANASCALTQVN